MATSLKKAAKDSGTSGRFDDPIKGDMYQIPTKNTQIRAWEEVHEARSHYVEFYSEKKGGKTGFPEFCLNWDPVKEAVVDGGCPLCEKGHKTQTHYYLYIIERRAQQKTGSTIVKVVRFTGKFAGKVGKLSEMAYPDMDPDEAPDATDRKQGFDIFISQSNNSGKTEYECGQSDKKPLTKDEIAAFEDYAEEHNISKMIKPFIRSRTEVLNQLTKMGVDGFGGSKPAGGGREQGQARGKKRSYEDFDEVPEDGDKEPAAKPSRRARDEDDEPPARKPAKRTSLTGDDDEEDADDVRPKGKSRLDKEDDEPPAKPRRSYATASADDAPDADDEE